MSKSKQLKVKIKNLALKNHMPAQAVLQEKIAGAFTGKNFALKG